jgi:hypothetical protein
MLWPRTVSLSWLSRSSPAASDDAMVCRQGDCYFVCSRLPLCRAGLLNKLEHNSYTIICGRYRDIRWYSNKNLQSVAEYKKDQ